MGEMRDQTTAMRWGAAIGQSLCTEVGKPCLQAACKFQGRNRLAECRSN